MTVFAPPEVSLTDPVVGIGLRPWRLEDAAALAAAWADPSVAALCGVPTNPSVDSAERWIARWHERADDGRALDLAVVDGTGSNVLGEVGVWPFRTPGSGRVASDVVELGWWTAPAERGRGRASAAVALVADWAESALAPARLVARIRPGHVASETVAARAGFSRRGPLDDHHDLWARPARRSAPATVPS